MRSDALTKASQAEMLSLYIRSISGDLINMRPDLVALDQFTDANGTALEAHTMDKGPGWSAEAGGMTIQGNQARANTFSASRCFYDTDPGVPDYVVRCGINPPAAGACGLCVQSDVALAFGMLFILDRAAGEFQLYDTAQSLVTPVATAPWTGLAGHSANLYITVSGADVTGELLDPLDTTKDVTLNAENSNGGGVTALGLYSSSAVVHALFADFMMLTGITPNV
jgi:hypothetical protein